jgi:hypothetical protein
LNGPKSNKKQKRYFLGGGDMAGSLLLSPASTAIAQFQIQTRYQDASYGQVGWRAELLGCGNVSGITKEACIQAAISDTLNGAYTSFWSGAIAHKVSIPLVILM